MTDKVAAALQREMFDAVVQRMGPRRNLGAPIRDSLFRYDVADQRYYPLARLLSSRGGKAGGGRGGRTRVALYLSLIWVASGGDHSSDRPARFWAGLLGIPDPDGAGSRVIRSTWRELEARNLVSLTPGAHSGAVPTVKLLREDGTGKPYTIPTGKDGDTYRRVPQTAWKALFHEPELTGPGLVMYLVTLRTAGRANRLEGLTFPRAHFQAEYGIGESTRKSGLQNLVRLGVLDAHRHRTDDYGDPSRRGRSRYTYDLFDLYADPRMLSAPAHESAGLSTQGGPLPVSDQPSAEGGAPSRAFDAFGPRPDSTVDDVF